MSERTKRKAAQNVTYNESDSKPGPAKPSAPKKPKTEKLPKFESFEKEVKPLKVTITTADGKEVFKGNAAPASFNSRSFGWQAEHKFKTNVTVDGKTQEVHGELTLSVPITGKLLPEANGTAK